MSSPTQRTLKELRKHGWTAQVVERWQAQARKRIDLFGVIDILAMKDGVLVGIQATSGANVSSRVKKAQAEPRLKEWLATGAGFCVWGWRKVRPRGMKRATWAVRKVEFLSADPPRAREDAR